MGYASQTVRAPSVKKVGAFFFLTFFTTAKAYIIPLQKPLKGGLLSLMILKQLLMPYRLKISSWVVGIPFCAYRVTSLPLLVKAWHIFITFILLAAFEGIKELDK